MSATESPKVSVDLLMVNQSTTYLFRSLAERLSSKYTVDLLAGSVEAGKADVLPFRVVKSIQMNRSVGWKRIFSWSVFTLRFTWEVFRGNPKIALVTTNPPFVPWACGLLNCIVRRPFIFVVYDVYPDVLARMGVLKADSLVYRLFQRLNANALRRASAVITLGNDMSARICEFCSTRPIVIPNWANTKVYSPIPKGNNSFVKANSLDGKFVVMYSGAFGATHDISSILFAAEKLRDVSAIVFVLIGKGTRIGEVASEVGRKKLPNVLLLPWQPLDMVPLSLAAADAHIVTLDAPYAGISFPSKFYTSLAVGAAIIALAPEETDLYKVVSELQVGVALKPGDPDALASAVRHLVQSREQTDCMGQRSREVAVKCFDEVSCAGRYREIIDELI